MNTVRQNFKRIASEAVTELKRLIDGGTGQQIVLKIMHTKSEILARSRSPQCNAYS
mgnify:CR=1 FL=1